MSLWMSDKDRNQTSQSGNSAEDATANPIFAARNRINVASGIGQNLSEE